MKPKQFLLHGVADVAKVCSQTLRTAGMKHVFDRLIKFVK
jgi:hypothetical protein